MHLLRGRRHPHPYFVVYLVAFVTGSIVASRASPSHPAWALKSSLIYRCEVGLTVGLFIYLVATTGWYAAQGRFLPQIRRGGGEPQSVDSAADPVDVVATDFNEYRKIVDFRFKTMENALGNMINRMEVLEKNGALAPKSRGFRKFRERLRRKRSKEGLDETA